MVGARLDLADRREALAGRVATMEEATAIFERADAAAQRGSITKARYQAICDILNEQTSKVAS